ncbi:hypothetical protein CERZMDRAFT_100929 [Cercospora zeae-maydis SCOH1-5]|uniref:Uncharacterized protein n=1 Tax=Cercospora zeae-maydis SCOH1-5 TaxID=717836 RepID=A0A6A6F832_9PEZI|nr:hypothetical protein CERZMDRAFT_100929 [Cercospora zeae-maydis SCOH1-5]
MPVPPPVVMAPSSPVSAQAEIVNRKRNTGHIRRDQFSAEMHPTEEAADKTLLHATSSDSFDSNDGATDNEDCTALGLETMRKASFPTQKVSISNYRKSSVPYTGQHATKIGNQGLKNRPPTPLPNWSQRDAQTLRGQRSEGDQETRTSNLEKTSGTGERLQETASNRAAPSRGVARVVAPSKRLPAQLSSTDPPVLRPSTSASVEMVRAARDVPNHAKPRFSQSLEINAEIEAITIFDDVIELSLKWPYIQEPDLSDLQSLSDEPLKNVLQYQKEALRAYYSENRFECVSHLAVPTPVPSEYLKCLKPGSVRLSSKLSHMGFVHRALQDLNARNADGLRSDVALLPITVEGEPDDVWISWNNIDDYDGIRGGWAAGQGKVGKRRRRRHSARTPYECDDDEL